MTAAAFLVGQIMLLPDFVPVRFCFEGSRFRVRI